MHFCFRFQMIPNAFSFIFFFIFKLIEVVKLNGNKRKSTIFSIIGPLTDVVNKFVLAIYQWVDFRKNWSMFFHSSLSFLLLLKKMLLLLSELLFLKKKCISNTYWLFGVELMCGAKTRSMPLPLTCSLVSFSPKPSNDSPPTKAKNPLKPNISSHLTQKSLGMFNSKNK